MNSIRLTANERYRRQIGNYCNQKNKHGLSSHEQQKLLKKLAESPVPEPKKGMAQLMLQTLLLVSNICAAVEPRQTLPRDNNRTVRFNPGNHVITAIHGNAQNGMPALPSWHSPAFPMAGAAQIKPPSKKIPYPSSRRSIRAIKKFENFLMAKRYIENGKKYPQLLTIAKNELKKAIKAKTQLHINPDNTFFNRFSSAFSDAHVFTGWRHDRATLIESGMLTEYVLKNFPADAQDNLDVVDQMCGIYNTNALTDPYFNSRKQIAIKPSVIARIIWDMDFYYIFINHLDKYWQDKSIQEASNVYTLFFALSKLGGNHRKNAEKIFLNQFGLIGRQSSAAMIYFFDINGYLSTDALVWESLISKKILLYLPRNEKIVPFSNISAMRDWLINLCRYNASREHIAAHFSLYDRQDGIIYDGVDSWLAHFADNEFAKRYADKIWRSKIPVLGNLPEALLIRQEERSYFDADVLIKSDAEIGRDMAARYLSAIDNILPNPVTPLISLGVDIDQMLTGDNAAERRQGAMNVINDGINIAIMALTDVLSNKVSLAKREAFNPGFETGDTGLTSQVRIAMAAKGNRAWHRGPDNVAKIGGIKQDMFRYLAKNRQHKWIHPQIFNKIRAIKLLGKPLDQIVPYHHNARGIIFAVNGKTYINIGNEYFPIFKKPGINNYYIGGGKQVAVFYDKDYKIYLYQPESKHTSAKKKLAYEAFSCRKKRHPLGIDGNSCSSVFGPLANILRDTHRGIPARKIEPNLSLVPENPFIYQEKNTHKNYIKHNNEYFLIKANPGGVSYSLYSHRSVILPRLWGQKLKKVGDIFYSHKRGGFSRYSKIDLLQESLNLSPATARLYVICTKNMEKSSLTGEEISTIAAYGSNNNDAINEFLEKGMPDRFISSWIRDAMKAQVAELDSALNKIPPYPGVVYRGCSLSKRRIAAIKADDVLAGAGFLSSSVDRQIAGGFARAATKDHAGVLLEMRIKKLGHPIMLYTRHLAEGEVLLERNSFFRVRSIENNKFIVDELARGNVNNYLKKRPSAKVVALGRQ